MARTAGDKLNDQQQLFVDEYLLDLSQTQAAIRAGYSPRSATRIACNLMANPKVRAAVDKALAARSKRTGITADRILRELGRCGFYNALDFINMDDAKVKTTTSVDDGAVIASVKVKVTPTEDGDIVEREIKCVDKLKALEMAGKHLGMFEEKVKVTVVPQIIDDVSG